MIKDANGYGSYIKLCKEVQDLLFVVNLDKNFTNTKFYIKAYIKVKGDLYCTDSSWYSTFGWNDIRDILKGRKNNVCDFAWKVFPGLRIMFQYINGQSHPKEMDMWMEVYRDIYDGHVPVEETMGEFKFIEKPGQRRLRQVLRNPDTYKW